MPRSHKWSPEQHAKYKATMASKRHNDLQDNFSQFIKRLEIDVETEWEKLSLIGKVSALLNNKAND